MPEREESRAPAIARANLVLISLLAIISPGLIALPIASGSGLWTVNPALPIEVRCAQVLNIIFLRHWFVTLPCIVIMTVGMHLLVTAMLNRRRLVLNFATAVVLTWVLVGLIVGFFLMGQLMT